MEWYEVNAALKYSHYAIKDNWEQARLIAYMIAQVNNKRHLKFGDIAKFYWENETDEEDAKPITKEDIERLNNLAKAYLNQI